MKVPKRLDQPKFWRWAIVLVIAHIGLSLLSAQVRPFGALDTVTIVTLALAVGARFRDIGWPAWIGPTFMLGTMLALPLVAVGYAITSHLGPP